MQNTKHTFYCPTCGSILRLRCADEIFKEAANPKQLYRVCSHYPQCSTIIRANKAGEPIGRAGDKSLRKLRVLTHSFIDMLYKSGTFSTQDDVYDWLCEQMQCDGYKPHMRMMNEADCSKALKICEERAELAFGKQILNRLKSISVMQNKAFNAAVKGIKRAKPDTFESLHQWLDADDRNAREILFCTVEYAQSVELMDFSTFYYWATKVLGSEDIYEDVRIEQLSASDCSILTGKIISTLSHWQRASSINFKAEIYKNRSRHLGKINEARKSLRSRNLNAYGDMLYR